VSKMRQRLYKEIIFSTESTPRKLLCRTYDKACLGVVTVKFLSGLTLNVPQWETLLVAESHIINVKCNESQTKFYFTTLVVVSIYNEIVRGLNARGY
jgi:hypothetical protein